MTTTLERTGPGPLLGPPPAVRRVPAWVTAWTPVALAVLVVALRLPAVAAAPGADEAGYLMVARQWRPGDSLYGDLWVDRPPLLITVFRVAADLGGLVPLRLIGAVAAGLVVLGVARVVRQVVEARTAADAYGPEVAARASAGAALVAAALCVSPVVGATEVNGELLAAPLVVWGMSAVLGATVRSLPAAGQVLRGAAGGLCLVAAVLVKQNLADVGVFAASVLLVGVVRRETTLAHAGRVAGGLLGGVVAGGGAVALWTVAHGTSLAGVYEAMYPFRVQAARALAASANTAPGTRLVHLLSLLVLSGVPVLAAVAAAGVATRRVRGTTVWGLGAMLAFASASIYLGGNYWSHYLVQLVVPVSVLAGLVLAGRQPGARVAVALVVVSGLVGLAVASPHATSPGSALGRAVADAAHPDDSIVTVFGHADVSETSGLSTPYPYLWSLPLKVRDPRGALLARTLSGAHAPTWFVTFAHVRSLGFDAGATRRAVTRHYHRVAVLDGHTVYLHDGLTRAVPTLPPPSVPTVHPLTQEPS